MTEARTSYPTIVDILRDRALSQPSKIGYTFLADGENESGCLNYETLDRQARAIASGLQALGATKGSRALVIYPYHSGLEFIAAFFGCLYAGVVAVTDNPPRHSKAIAQLQDRLVSTQSTVALTTGALLKSLKEQLAQNPDLAPKLTEIPWIATDEVESDRASDWREAKIAPDTIAFLQHTSGSTGVPKGVMVTHKNLLHNSELIYQCFGHHDGSQGVIWLPPYHDMGLIGGVVQPLYGGFPVTLMSPVILAQKPLYWLQAISRYKATTSGGPNFAYDFVAQSATPEQIERLDLSHWDLAFSGAEPVRAHTIERFVATFAPCGFRSEAFYPCYGMAETTLFISGGDKQAAPVVRHIDSTALEQNRVVAVEPNDAKARAIVGCGRPWLGDRIAIVDPDSFKPCRDREVGEIWAAGVGISQGYWNLPEETQRNFQAYLATGEGTFLRTGDLGYIDDGELFITGRLKDLMIFMGRNRYPHQIEETVQKCHPALRINCGAAFSVELAGEERLVIAQEVERSYLRKLDTEKVIEAIRQAVAQEHYVDVYAIRLLKTGSIPKTSSGKIQRRACRTQFLEGSLNVVGEWENFHSEQSRITGLGMQSQKERSS
jgi:acyl-CoA synthetase (AMP-forming)/AMP-acid ligase II